jgi:hypothetical protein
MLIYNSLLNQREKLFHHKLSILQFDNENRVKIIGS